MDFGYKRISFPTVTLTQSALLQKILRNGSEFSNLFRSIAEGGYGRFGFENENDRQDWIDTSSRDNCHWADEVSSIDEAIRIYFS